MLLWGMAHILVHPGRFYGARRSSNSPPVLQSEDVFMCTGVPNLTADVDTTYLVGIRYALDPKCVSVNSAKDHVLCHR